MSPHDQDPDTPPGSPDQPEHIGPYKILETLAEGGMGVIYLAEQREPVRRQVALKVIKPGMDTKQVVARFEVERQALAVMDHANIAKVFDGGVSETGRPYFAMELVRGVPITEYCDMHKLPVRKRLDVFIPVCRAVQHAHQKGVIHRDLKPSNILVTLEDGKPVPKVIDFGIAKAMGQSLTEKTLHTQQGVMLGTPAYMSPEQAEPSALDIDTRTDIYSLGTILYELLAGELPFDPKELQGVAAILTLRDTEPPTPSTRYESLGDRQELIAGYRRTNPRDLTRRLRGDLDWITMKAMEKDRSRRYETTNGLANDIVRYLKDEPVSARPPTTWYRFGRFARRHRTAVMAGSAVAAALVAGVVLATSGFIRATRAETEALREAETAQQVSDFLVGLFAFSDPDTALGDTITAREILERGADGIESELGEQPLVQARLMATIGAVYEGLGIYDRAQWMHEKALSIRRAAHGGEHAEVASSLFDVGRVMRRRGEYKTAESLQREALAMRRQLLGPEDLEVAASLDELGLVLSAKGEYEAAVELLREALQIQRQQLGEEALAVASTMNGLAEVLREKGDYGEAEPLYRSALANRREQLDPNSRDLAESLGNLAIFLLETGELEEAEPLMREALAIDRRTLGPDHNSIASDLNNLAAIVYGQGDIDAAAEYIREALEMNRRVLGPGHPDVTTTMVNLSTILAQKGDYKGAEELMLEVLAMDRRAFGTEHPNYAKSLGNLARLKWLGGDYAAADSLYRQDIAIFRRTLGPKHPTLARHLSGLGRLLLEQDDYDSAEPLLLEAYDIYVENFGNDDQRVARVAARLVELYEERNEPEKAAEYSNRR